MDYQLTLPTILRRAEALFPHKEIVSRLPDKSIHRYAYRDMALRAKKLAVALQKLGVNQGDRVATLCWNHYQHLEAYFAVPCMGAVIHPLNIRFSAEELTYIINHAEDKVIIVDQVLLPLFEQFKSAVNISAVIVIPQTGEPISDDYLNYEDVVASGAPSHYEPFEGDENTAAFMCYTSGTTGKSKGILYSHRSVMLHALAILLSCSGVGINEQDVVLPIVPMFHASAWAMPYNCAFVGASQVFPGPYLDAGSLLELMETEKVTLTGGVPTVLMSLLNCLDAAARPYQLSLRLLFSGGSALPRFLVKAFDERYGLKVLHTWGMTEMSPLGVTNAETTGQAKATKEGQYDHQMKQGYPVPFVEMRGRNEAGIIPWDGVTVGELEVRGPWVAGAYYGETEPGEKFTADGWLKTGDIASIHPDGCIEIKDRSKDVIKSGGEWISSVALENALMGHPTVLEAAVIGVPDEKWMERPFAYVVPRPGASVSPAELKQFLSGRFARFWVPEGYAAIDAIPKTSVGKFLKAALREKYERENKASQ